jgi:hypothetical protein
LGECELLLHRAPCSLSLPRGIILNFQNTAARLVGFVYAASVIRGMKKLERRRFERQHHQNRSTLFTGGHLTLSKEKKSLRLSKIPRDQPIEVHAARKSACVERCLVPAGGQVLTHERRNFLSEQIKHSNAT